MVSENDTLTEKIIGLVITVHRHLGPGLMESAYEACLMYELREAGIAARNQLEQPIQYKEIKIDVGYRIDVLVEDRVILELKSVEAIKGIHKAQTLTYMKLSGKRVGLLMNFNVELLKDGIHRLAL